MGALCVTYCVGGLSVCNAIAGAYAEKSPVVVITGSPGLNERIHNPLLHHMVRNFAGVLMSAFLEHEVEPNGLLQGVAKVLQPGGVVIIKVPNYGSWNRKIRAEKWCGFRLPDHVNYFTPENLEALIVRQGMKVVQFGLADRQPTSDNMWIVAAK